MTRTTSKKTRPATDAPPARAVSASSDAGLRPLTLAAIVGGLFLVRLSLWMTSDLWFDEVLTINDYVLRRDVAGIVGQYPAANHHVLFSVMLWLWSQAIDPRLWEWLLRLPCVLLSAAMVMLPVLHWRQWLGRGAATACAVTLAASLIVGSFAWQLRGYALAMFLGAVAISGAMELVAGSRRRGLAMLLPAAVLLPLVMPSNVVLLAALGLLLILAKPRETTWRAWSLGTLLPFAAAGALGCAYYLTVWSDFRRVWAQAEGWPSGLAVVRALAIAAVAHFGPVLLLFAWQHKRLAMSPTPTTAPTPDVRADITLAWKVLAPILVLSGVLLLFQRPAPFPRTFLVCLPAATFAVFLACRDGAVWSRVSPVIIAGVIALNGLVWQLVTDRFTAGELRHGQHPQNLVMEYYRGRNDVSAITRALHESGAGKQLVLLADFHEYPTTQHYWRERQMPVERVLVAWGKPSTDWQSRFGPDAALAVQAYGEAHAHQLLRQAKLLPADAPPPRLKELIRTRGLSVWVVPSGGGGEATTRPSDRVQ